MIHKIALAAVLLWPSAAFACGSDISILNQRGIVSQLDTLTRYHTIQLEAATVNPVAFAGQLADLPPASCVDGAFKRQAAQMIKASAARHPGMELSRLGFLTLPEAGALRYTFEVVLFNDGADLPFVVDRYKWDGKRYRFIQTESFVS